MKRLLTICAIVAIVLAANNVVLADSVPVIVNIPGRPDLIGTITTDGTSVIFNITAVGQVDDGDAVNTSKYYTQSNFDNEYFTISAAGKFLKYNMWSGNTTPGWGTSWGDATAPLPAGVTFSQTQNGDDFVYVVTMSYSALGISVGDTFSVQIKARDFNDDFVQDYEGFTGFNGLYSQYRGLWITDTGQFDVTIPPPPSEVWVDDNYYEGGENDGHTWGYDAFDNIQDGIDAVAGSTVYVAAGTYAENLVINKQLILQGTGSGSTTVDASGGSYGILLEAGGSSAAPADRQTIKDLSIIDATLDGIRAYKSGGFNLDHVTLENLVITGSGGRGVELHNGTIVSDMEITNCELINNTLQGLRTSTGTPLDGLLITDSSFNWNSYGIYLNTNTSNLTILRSTFNNSVGGYGGYMTETGPLNGLTIEDSEFKNNVVGLMVWNVQDNADITITGSSFQDNDKWGVLIWGQTLTNVLIQCSSVLNNDALGLGYYGIDFNAYGEVMTNVAVHSTNITGHTIGGGVKNRNTVGTAIVDATNNWWGDNSGPCHLTTNPGGLGDAVSDNVDYYPWLGAPYDGPIITNVNPYTAAMNTAFTISADIGVCCTSLVQYSINGQEPGDMDDTDGDGTFTSDPVVIDTVGIYELCVTAEDCCGNQSEECIVMAVYDPDGGFVTGGGWIDSPPGAYMPGETTVVTQANIGVNWSTNDTRNEGYVAFVEGPATPPLGSGSLEMGTSASEDKAQLFNYDYMGTPLDEIDALSYATYRDSSSTNSSVQYPALNIEVDYTGDGSSYTTLVWEPIYAYGSEALQEDTWQVWDTMVPSQTAFGGGWWSTRDIPGVCSVNCFVSWDDILANNPNAKIKYGFGVNVGSGWTGAFTGAVDALTISLSGDTVTYDFEPVAPPDPTGRANFGFVSKYKKGANVPTGQTEFVFQAADLNFHSSSYNWLVVNQSGENAQFKGAGTINGAGDYKFMLWAGDGTPDTFWIKIWEEDELSNETVIYDNGSAKDISGGSIVIHIAKKN